MKTAPTKQISITASVFYAALLAILVLAACNPATTTTPVSTPGATEPPQVNTPTPTKRVLATKAPSPFPLSDPGPYLAGYQDITLVDESRGGREIGVTLWYPALEQPTSSGYQITKNAPLDRSGAPYPLILTSAISGDELFRTHLASYGFVMATVRYPDEYATYNIQSINHPRDLLFVLDQLAKRPPEAFTGMIDADRTGVSGYSLEGYITLAVGGARWNPEHFFTSCQNAPTSIEQRPQFVIDVFCDLLNMWDEFEAVAGEELTTSQDGLWQPMSDERIRAIAPMAPDGAWFYGERGLAEITIPVLMICGTEDNAPSYRYETVYIFEHLKTTDKYLISFIGKEHNMTFEQEAVRRMNHFVTAFFGYYLQGREDYLRYFSEEFVSQFDDLAWGVYNP